jgi:hypothetical protein
MVEGHGLIENEIKWSDLCFYVDDPRVGKIYFIANFTANIAKSIWGLCYETFYHRNHNKLECLRLTVTPYSYSMRGYAQAGSSLA